MKRIPKFLKINDGKNVKNLNEILHFLTEDSIDIQPKFSHKFGEKTKKTLEKIEGLEVEDIVLEGKKLNPKVTEVLNQRLLEKKYKDKKKIASLQENLKMLNEKGLIRTGIGISQEELEVRNFGNTSQNVLKVFQRERGLKVTGKMDTATEEKLENVLKATRGRFNIKRISDAFNPKNKSSVGNLHQVLLELKLGLDKEGKEIENRKIGERTIAVIRQFQKDNRLKQTGEINKETSLKLNERLVAQRYKKTEHIVGFHGNIDLLLKKKFLNIDHIIEKENKRELDRIVSKTKKEERKKELANELLKKFTEDKTQNRIGSATNLLTKYFQGKYGLAPTGKIDVDTERKIESVSTSIQGSKKQPKKQLKLKNAKSLNRVVRKLRLNMTGNKVADLQNSLAWMGYKITKEEFDAQRFGKTTQNALLQFQKEHKLAHTGDTLSKATVNAINTKIAVANPTVLLQKYRVRGTVRDSLWRPVPRVTVRVFERGLRGRNKLLGERTTFNNGFYDILYAPPINPNTQQPINPLNLVVKVIGDGGKELHSKNVNNVKQTFWVNFTEGKDYYKGICEFDQYLKLLNRPLKEANLQITAIQQSDEHQDIASLAAKTKIPPRAVLLLSLTHRIADSINTNAISAAVIYAFLRQNQPPEMPSDIFPDEPREWNEWIPRLVETLANGIVFLDKEVQKEVLENALQENFIPRTIQPRQGEILESFASLRQSFALTKPLLIGNGNLQQLLDISAIPATKYSQVATTFIQYGGINELFWENVETEAIIDSNELADLKTVTDLGVIARNHTPALEVMKNMIADSTVVEFSTARDFAKLSLDEWEGMVKDNGINIPANIDGNTESEKVKFYASTLKSKSEQLFPTIAFVSALNRSNEHGLNHIGEVTSFVYNHPDFDFKRDNIEKFNIEKGDILLPSILQEAKIVQRVKKLTTSSKSGTELLNLKLHSSIQIYFYGKGRLFQTLKAKNVGITEIKRLYANAEQQYAKILAKLVQFRYDFQIDNPKAIPQFFYSQEQIQQYKNDIPNIEALFGSVDYCECEHCSSLYSPAAYLTDILRFLGEKDAVQHNDTVQDVLFGRRPDIKNIQLNCENTHTPLPYIDLVNEILENAMPQPQSNFSYQTTLSPNELKAIPEHIRLEVYAILKGAKFPMKTSFNLWEEESRLFLTHLGVPRYQLMKVFQNRNAAPQVPSEVAIAAEYFGISSEELLFIVPEPSTTHALATFQEDYWGTSNVILPNLNVEQFLDKSGLTYKELLSFLQVKFVNPEADKSVINRPHDDCDVKKQVLDRINLPKLDRMHRFLRLWRRSSWEMWELDLLIRNEKIGGNDLNGNCLVNLWQFGILQKKLGTSVEELLAFYANINTEIRVSPSSSQKQLLPLYHRLFLNKTINNPIDAAFDFPIPNDATSNHITTILSALVITEEELDFLLPLTNEILSEATLGTLYRYVLLAKKLRLSIEDLLRLTKIVGINDPFDSLQTTYTLLENYEATKESPFSLLELEYVLFYTPKSSLGVRIETITQQLEILRISLSNLQAGLNGQNETAQELMDKLLSKLPAFGEEGTRQTAISLIEGKWDGTDAARQDFINERFGAFIPTSANPIGALTQNDALSEAAIQVRFKYVVQHLYPFLSDNLVTEHLAAAMNISNKNSETLLKSIGLSGNSLTLLQHLQSESFIAQDEEGVYNQEISIANYPSLYQVFHLTHKVSILLNRFQISSNELIWFLEHHAAINTIDLANLPIDNVAPSMPFTQWLNWQQFLQFKNHFPEPEEVSFYDILEMGINEVETETIFEGLAELTQWRISNIKSVHNGLGLVAVDYANAATYHQIWESFKQIRLTGVPASMMFDWAIKSTAFLAQKSIAQTTRQAAKSKYEPEEWLKKVQPIEDELRERKRNALSNYLIENSLRTENPTIESSPNPKYWENRRDLFHYFLIDIEMNACQLTSRIRQAISSVQLFIQRCFLNLESRFVKIPNNDPDLENNWNHWRWMKNYRIWEANRKVFLYPENWIEPELRDDKSPFFKELENEILQNEITHTNVEQAFLSYLQKVDEVANLEIMGIYHDFHGPTEEVHVIARTKTIPHIYYHRTYNLDFEYWTAWDKVEIDITGNHVIPVVYNRKLHLFWLIFDEKPEKVRKNPPAQPSDTPQDNQEPAKNLEIQLAWSVKKHNGWAPKVISKERLIHPWQRPHHSYHLKPRYKASNNSLWIDLFVSTSEEFNDTLFYDQYSGKKKKRTKSPYNETFRPWHSSSFVFNGAILSLKLRGLKAPYFKPNLNKYENISSFEYVHNYFGEDGRKHQSLAVNSSDYAGRLLLPYGMHFHNNYLTNNTRDNRNQNQLNILSNGLSSAKLLNRAKAPFKAVAPMLIPNRRPIIYQDKERSFFVKSEWQYILQDYQKKIKQAQYVFYPFYHPYTNLFIRELNRSGLDGLLNRKIQTQPASYSPKNNFNFKNTYAPVSPHKADETAQRDIVDFSFGGAYSIYNWELFFHAPMLIAGKLSQNQRFEEAMRWYHYIFDPTNTENLPVPQRYWITKPFYQHSASDYKKQRIQNIIDKIDEFRDQVAAWKNNPFKPHLIARYRPVAYQRNVVMKYIDNLIAWGDQLFRRDTMESINQATLLYMLAYELLGDRPQAVPAIPRNAQSFEQLQQGGLDVFGNTKVEIALENDLSLPIRVRPSTTGNEPLPRIEVGYFCIPRNEKLMTYWDTVEDRLFKIRNCMNIEGIVRQLSLFAPPIDPALLVKAAAAGVDLSSVLNDLSVPNPHYRFRTLLQAAVQFCNHVESLGNQLLSILEKKDAEGLALLRASNEIRLQKAIKEVRKLQIDEAEEVVKGLERNKELIGIRKEFYEQIEKLISQEEAYFDNLTKAKGKQESAQIAEITASYLGLLPNLSVGIAGFGGTPTVTLGFGGSNLASASRAVAGHFSYDVIKLRTNAEKSSTQGSFERRWADWKLQEALANKEIDQVSKQIAAAEIRIAVAEKELSNQELAIENIEIEEEYLKNKYTNEQLYSWMITQISSVYFQSYQLAYDMAKRAEKSFRRELGLQNSNYIQFGYWDSLKKGLLSGEKLMYDLHRMESAYYEQNRRELELIKHISLAQIAPWCLLQLKTAGECVLNLPEWLFDMDYPGHYMRRIKSVSISIPCVTGPYTGVHCTLSLHKSQVRISNLVGGNYAWAEGDFNDSRFYFEMGTIQSIATSHAQLDSGVFELNFNDERFLPFEGAGAISTWGIKMPRSNNQFDFATISDVILHIQYTARNGGGNLELAAQANVDAILPTEGVRLFSLKHEFPTEWHRFLYPSIPTTDQELKLNLGVEHYPFFSQGKAKLNVTEVKFVIDGQHLDSYELELQLPPQPNPESPNSETPNSETIIITKEDAFSGAHVVEHELGSTPSGRGEWNLKIKRENVLDFQSLPTDDLNDVLMVVHFKVS